MEVSVMFNKVLFNHSREYLNDTDIFSVKVLSKQYSPRYYRETENKFGYSSWRMHTKLDGDYFLDKH
jgi:hypothetical protein